MDIQGDSLVIYTPSTDPAELVSGLSELFGAFPHMAKAELKWISKHTTYTAMFRFTLRDEKKRLFSAERWCFRGGIDGWFFLVMPQSLPQLAELYLPHLNKESFFELM